MAAPAWSLAWAVFKFRRMLLLLLTGFCDNITSSSFLPVTAGIRHGPLTVQVTEKVRTGKGVLTSRQRKLIFKAIFQTQITDGDLYSWAVLGA